MGPRQFRNSSCRTKSFATAPGPGSKRATLTLVTPNVSRDPRSTPADRTLSACRTGTGPPTFAGGDILLRQVQSSRLRTTEAGMHQACLSGGSWLGANHSNDPRKCPRTISEASSERRSPRESLSRWALSTSVGGHAPSTTTSPRLIQNANPDMPKDLIEFGRR
jgi:hypothetical protein